MKRKQYKLPADQVDARVLKAMKRLGPTHGIATIREFGERTVGNYIAQRLIRRGLVIKLGYNTYALTAEGKRRAGR
jgi:Mn-dependent DtxR family transcriptional regulator